MDRHRTAAFIVHHSHESDLDSVMQFLQDNVDAKKSVPTIVISDRYDTVQALALLQRGATDYLSRPLDISRLSLLINFLTCRSRLPLGESQDAKQSSDVAGDELSIGPCDEMADTLRQLRTAAASLATVLLCGETGTGKNHSARLLHKISPRKQHPFLVVNCAALVPSLVESEIFGHAKGAFTGADSDHVGKLEAAGEGTLMLDEIDALPLEIQPKLLRVLDERVFERVGSTESRPFRARLVVATNRDLEERIRSGLFRADLFYRINVVPMQIPPLRERKSQIVELACSFLAEFTARDGRASCELSAQAMAALQAYQWPGNIRELRNVIERQVALCPRDRVELSDLPTTIQESSAACPAVSHPSEPETASGSKWFRKKIEAEVKTITDALAKTSNNRAHAARELGISRVTLYKKMHKYGLM